VDGGGVECGERESLSGGRVGETEKRRVGWVAGGRGEGKSAPPDLMIIKRYRWNPWEKGRGKTPRGQLFKQSRKPKFCRCKREGQVCVQWGD